MLFPQLQPYKIEYPDMAEKLSALEVFLDAVLHRPPTNPRVFFSYSTHDVNPLRVCKELKVSKSDAIALLYLCHKAGILIPRFDVYCPETEHHLQSYFSAEELPRVISCEWHDVETEHDIHSYYVNIMFQFTRETVEGRFLYAAAG